MYKFAVAEGTSSVIEARCTVKESKTGFLAKAKDRADKAFEYVGTKAKAFSAWLSCMTTMAMCSYMAYAVPDLNQNYSVTTNINDFDPEKMILNLAFWLCRLIGISMLIFGIYGYVTARKDGEAESMNGAIGKLVSGCVLVAMPAILKGVGLISM